MTNPFQAHGEEMEQRYRLNQAMANRNGLVKVKLSDRRFIVVQFGATVCGDSPYAYFAGSVAFGPATYSHCEDFIHAKLRSLPTEDIPCP